MEEKPSCEPCRMIYKEKGEPPPCRDCIPELDEENEEAVQVFMAVKNQVITMGNQIVDLNLVAVEAVMNIYEVQDKKRVLALVLNCFRKMMAEGKNAG